MIRSFHRALRGTLRTLPLALGAGVLFIAGTRRASAQQDDDPLSRLDTRNKFAVELIIDSAKVANLPTKPMLSVVLEGLSKKADGKRIVQQVYREFIYLRNARSSLGSVSEEELSAAAAVLQAGAKPDQLAAFKARQKNRNDLTAFGIWADLMTRDVPSDEASSAITKLWQDGADDADFYGLWKSVQTDILQGLNPGTALQNRMREQTPGRSSKISPPAGQENQSSS